MSKYTDRHVGVFIGRFQPFHNGHLDVIKRAVSDGLTRFKIGIGSAYGPRTIKNPFTANEREDMILSAFKTELFDDAAEVVWSKHGGRLHKLIPKYGTSLEIEFVYLEDYLYNDHKWFMQFTAKLNAVMQDDDKPVLLGYRKDTSSFYLDMFKHMEDGTLKDPYVVTTANGPVTVSATNIRTTFLRTVPLVPDQVLPKSVSSGMFKFACKDARQVFEHLVQERMFIEDYKQQYANIPYPPTFITVDALVVQSNNILLIERKDYPGKGLWALPGGFIQSDETIETAVLRELKEETGLKVPLPVLKSQIQKVQVFDHPERSSRGRTVTHCHLINLAPTASGDLPHIVGNSDAKQAKWFPLNKFIGMRDKLFEDHWDMVSFMLGI